MTDSSTGGYLAPGAATPEEGQPLEDFLQSVVSGITGLPGSSVFPRWQPEPPNLPAGDWAAVGIISWQGDTYPYVQHDPVLGDQVQEHEELEVMCSFYGVNASKFCAFLKQGLAIAQNREALQVANMGLVSVGRATAVPSLVKEKWLNRIDRTVTIRRLIQRFYPVLSFASASATIVADSSPVITRNINVTP